MKPEENAFTWAQWPKDVPRPTEEQFAQARKRYADEIREHPTYSDWACGLDFVMGAFNRLVWWPLFFPEQKEACDKQMREELEKIIGHPA